MHVIAIKLRYVTLLALGHQTKLLIDHQALTASFQIIS